MVRFCSMGKILVDCVPSLPVRLISILVTHPRDGMDASAGGGGYTGRIRLLFVDGLGREKRKEGSKTTHLRVIASSMCV